MKIIDAQVDEVSQMLHHSELKTVNLNFANG